MLKRMVRKEEKGFTLIELLIVVGIIGVLLAVAVAALTGLIGTGKAEAQQAELSAVQTAIDAYMAKTQSENITARSSAGIINAADGDAPFNIYLRRLPTKYSYAWTTNGTASQP